MSNIIEELYYGNITPLKETSDFDDVTEHYNNILNDSEAFLMKSLSGEDYDQFFKYITSSDIVRAQLNLKSFTAGLRLGAKFTYDTFVKNNEKYLSDN